MGTKESSGWIKLHRKIMDGESYFSEPFCRNMAWVDLLLLANHKPAVIRKRGVRVELKRGDVGMGSREIALRWKWSRGKVLRFLNELEDDGMIVQQKNNVTGCITIQNYSFWQDGDTTDSTTDSTTNDTTNVPQIVPQTGHKRYQNKNDKNDKNVKNVKKKGPARFKLQPVNPLLIVFSHHGEEFKKTYLEFLRMLELKGKPATEPTTIEQMQFLKQYDEATATGILKYSLKGGYPQLYEPKKEINGSHKQPFESGKNSASGGTSEARIKAAKEWGSLPTQSSS